MRLAFEDVSYSYEGGEAKKKRGRRKERTPPPGRLGQLRPMP